MMQMNSGSSLFHKWEVVNISEYGLKIRNIEASTLYEYNLGVRQKYEYKDAMFTNSLFKDFLERNGLQSYKGDSTRDLICLEFNYGTRSFEKETEHLINMVNKTSAESRKAHIYNDNILIQRAENKKAKIVELAEAAYDNRYKYKAMNTDELRKLLYNDGVDVEYITYKKNGDVKKRETIHYKMLFRSTGKAKKGSCMFIRDSLYNIAINYLRMGIQLPEKNSPTVEISAYAPLVASGIVGYVKIKPEQILVLKDVDRTFKTNVISIETDENKHCVTREIEDYTLKNTLFDGQALIDSSIFPDCGNGYILLRQHFCKMAAFNTEIQQFYKDYFGDNYETATVTDMWEKEHYVKDIKLITTDNAVKFLKFNVSFDYWAEWIRENGCYFGIVKTAHPSKIYPMQRMSYQMVNSLNIDPEFMANVTQETVNYIMNLKYDDDFFLDYLRHNKNFSNDYEVLVALVNQNHDFINSTYFRQRRNSIIDTYVLNFRSGKVINNAENLTIVGSPFAMLLYATCNDESIVDLDDSFRVEKGTIQCYTNRFEFGEYLAGFRSPFNSKNNLSYLHNVYDRNLEKYFHLGEQCIAINMIHTDFQDKNNGLTYWLGSWETMFKN